MMRNAWGRREEGQAVVIIALAMVALIAFLSLAIDGGTAFALRRKMQNAADAASMAGADMLQRRFYTDNLCGTAVQQVLAAIHTFAERNGVADTNGSPGDWENANVTAHFMSSEGGSLAPIEPSMDEMLPPSGTGCIPPETRGVRVINQGSFRSFFAGLIGREEFTAAARASNLAFPSKGAQSTSFWGVFPVTVLCQLPDPEDCFQEGEPYELFDTDDKEAPGSFGWWGGAGASVTACYVQPSSPGCDSESPLTIETLPMMGETTTGVKNSEKDEVDSRYLDELVIPIYNGTNGETGSNLEYNFIGLAVFKLVEYHFTNLIHYPATVNCFEATGQKCFSGEFVGWLLAPQIAQ